MHESWKRALSEELKKPYISDLKKFLEAEYSLCRCSPPQEQIFRAFEETPLDDIRVVILGQDPYHEPGQANGLAFAFLGKTDIPRSLRNVEKELLTEYGSGTLDYSLVGWARQGVFLLNSVLSTRMGAAAAHAGRGWETFTDHVIRTISLTGRPTAFMLWGKYAAAKADLIEDKENHIVIITSHPSPMAVNRGFFGSNCFLKTNEFLRNNGRGEIQWLRK